MYKLETWKKPALIKTEIYDVNLTLNETTTMINDVSLRFQLFTTLLGLYKTGHIKSCVQQTLTTFTSGTIYAFFINAETISLYIHFIRLHQTLPFILITVSLPSLAWISHKFIN